MNSIHNNGENDKSLHDDLDNLGHAYGKLEHDEPPDLLDQAILNRAHRAVEKKPHWMKFGWLHGLTTAAVFVLAFTIIVNQQEPSPDYENGMMSNEPELYQRQNAAKKESAMAADELRQEMKIKSDDQRDALRRQRTVAVPEILPVPSTAGNRAVPVEAEKQSASYALGNLTGKSQREDKDIAPPEILQEEILLEESDAMVASPLVSEMSDLAQPASIAEAELMEAKARGKTDLSADERLLAIIKLRQAGDISWKSELELFKENYPDYPVPDELTD